MLTRNELLDKLITALSWQQEELYDDWYDRATGKPWEESYHYLMSDNLEKEIIELEKQYD